MRGRVETKLLWMDAAFGCRSATEASGTRLGRPASQGSAPHFRARLGAACEARLKQSLRDVRSCVVLMAYFFGPSRRRSLPEPLSASLATRRTPSRRRARSSIKLSSVSDRAQEARGGLVGHVSWGYIGAALPVWRACAQACRLSWRMPWKKARMHIAMSSGCGPQREADSTQCRLTIPVLSVTNRVDLNVRCHRLLPRRPAALRSNLVGSMLRSKYHVRLL